MILNIKFNNFGSFRDSCDFTLEPVSSMVKSQNLYEEKVGDYPLKALRTSLIYGANGSGKTTLIKFVNALVQWVQSRDLDNRLLIMNDPIPLYNPFKFNKNKANADSSFSIEFIAEGKEYIFEASFNSTIVKAEKLSFRTNPEEAYATIYRRTGANEIKSSSHPIPDTFVKGLFPNHLFISKSITSWQDDLITPAAKYLASIIVYNCIDEDTGRDKKQEALRWLDTSDDNFRLVSNLFKVLGTGVQGIEVEKNENGKYTVYGLHSNYAGNQKIGKGRLSLPQESTGTRQLLFLGCYIFQALKAGAPIFVDELDANLHPIVVEIINKIFTTAEINKNKAQLVFTTHNVTMPNYCQLRKDQIWFTDKNDRGISSIYSLSDFSGVPENYDFELWYMAKKFGAVPKITSLDGIL